MYHEESFLDDNTAKAQILDFGRRIYNHGYVAANDGNISVKVCDNHIWITPTGVSKGYMTEDMLIKVDLNGNILEGSYAPSSEAKMHLRIYKESPHVRGVVHAHPLYATAFAIAGIPLDEPILVEAMLQLGTVPVVGYAKPGTYDIPDKIAPYCNSHNAVLLSNHGALTWGVSLHEAYYRMEVLETYAKMTLTVQNIGKKRCLSTNQIQELADLRVKIGLTGGQMPQGVAKEENIVDVLPRELS